MISTHQITEAEICAGFTDRIRPYLQIASLPIPRSYEGVIEALWKATDIIEKSLRVPCRVHVVLATSPFELNLSNGKLRFETAEGVVSSCVENMIFLDLNKIYAYSNFHLQVTIILEEFVHVLMNVGDEELVKHIVAILYEGIEYRDGQFIPRV